MAIISNKLSFESESLNDVFVNRSGYDKTTLLSSSTKISGDPGAYDGSDPIRIIGNNGVKPYGFGELYDVGDDFISVYTPFLKFSANYFPFTRYTINTYIFNFDGSLRDCFLNPCVQSFYTSSPTYWQEDQVEQGGSIVPRRIDETEEHTSMTMVNGTLFYGSSTGGLTNRNNHYIGEHTKSADPYPGSISRGNNLWTTFGNREQRACASGCGLIIRSGGKRQYSQENNPAFVEIVNLSGESRPYVDQNYPDNDIETKSERNSIARKEYGTLGFLYPNSNQTGDQWGQSLDIGNGRIVVSAPESNVGSATSVGSFEIFDLNGAFRKTVTPPSPSNDMFFGSDIAIGAGRIFTTGGGNLYSYDLNGNLLGTATTTTSYYGSNPTFMYDTQSYNSTEFYYPSGRCLAVSDGRVYVGAPTEGYTSSQNNSTNNRGYLYVFDLNLNLLQRVDEYAASGVTTKHYYGHSVRARGGVVVVRAGPTIMISADRLATTHLMTNDLYIYSTTKQTHILDLLD